MTAPIRLSPLLRLKSVVMIASVIMLQASLSEAQEDFEGADQVSNEIACYYVDYAFSECWTRRRSLAYTASAVAKCVCTVSGISDPYIDEFIPACTSYLKTAGAEGLATEYHSSFNDYCSSYAPTDTGPAVVPPITTSVPTDPDSNISGLDSCQAILGLYSFCQQSSNDLITEPHVASCLCHDFEGQFTTEFDDLLTPCYDWAQTWDTALATEVSSIFGFCTEHGSTTMTNQPTTTDYPGPKFTFSAPASTKTEGKSLTSLIGDDAASSACETVARIANACRTGELDPLTRAGVANCICQNPDSPEGGFGTKFDEFLTRCYPYAKTKSPGAASEILSLSGYCTRFADGGSTYTITTTSQDATQTVTEDVFETSNNPATSSVPNLGQKANVPFLVIGIIVFAVVILQ